MPKIKVFTSNLGFYETAVAARSQKMALAHWGITRNLFGEGTAKETNDPKAVEAALRKVGMVVRRPIGSNGPFEERADAERTLLKTRGSAPSKQERSPARPAKSRAKPRPAARSKRPKR
jgi:colicin import membrane protein